MGNDVQSLLQTIGATDFEYREVAALDRWQAAAQRWPLFTSINRLLLERVLLPHSARPPLPERRVGRAHVLAVVSLQGGCGRTTLAANLAQALAQNGRAALAVDLDPQATLGLHFGVELEEPVGALTPQLSPQAAAEWLARFRSGAAVFPFGSLSAGMQGALEATVQRDPLWLTRRLQSLIPQECEFVLLDTPPATHPLFRAAMGVADTVLCVLSPEPAAYATLPQMESLIEECVPEPARERTRYVLNRFDARRKLDSDFFASLRGMLESHTLPLVIHEDPVVPEALAKKRLIMQEAADSQVVASLGALADWLEGCALGELPARRVAAAHGAR